MSGSKDRGISKTEVEDVEARAGAPSGRIRILHLIDGLGGGGSERWVWDIVRLTDPERFEHRVVTVHADRGAFIFADRLRNRGVYCQRPASRALLGLRRVIDGLMSAGTYVPVRKTLAGIFLIGWYAPGVWHAVGGCLGFRPDVFHGHTYDGLRGAVILKCLARRPLLHTVPAQLSQMDEGGFGWMRALYARQHPRIDLFFAGVSFAELASLGVPRSKIVPIRGVVDLERADGVRSRRREYSAEIRRQLAIPTSAPLLLSVGNFHAYKGHIHAIEALSRLGKREEEPFWVALGEGAERQALERKAAELGLTSRVRLPGFVTDPLPYYAAADVYVRTPVIEAENLSSYDAMAMGLPVVGFDTGTETELISKAGHGVLVPNRDAAAMASALDGILSLPDRGAAIGEKGLEYARRHLDLRTAIADFEAAYVRLASTS